jgi:hypothetical protein
MVKMLKCLMILALIAGAGWLGWRHFFPDEKQQIRGMLNQLAGALSAPSQRKTVSKLVALDRIQSSFTLDVQVAVDIPGDGRHVISGREELMGLMQAGLSQLNDSKWSFWTFKWNWPRRTPPRRCYPPKWIKSARGICIFRNSSWAWQKSTVRGGFAGWNR